eukprot:g19518.t1
MGVDESVKCEHRGQRDDTPEVTVTGQAESERRGRPVYSCSVFTGFIGHGIRHCYRIDQGKKSEFYLTYLLTAGTGALAILALCLTVDRFGRRGILLLAMTLTGLASLILLGLTE